MIARQSAIPPFALRSIFLIALFATACRDQNESTSDLTDCYAEPVRIAVASSLREVTLLLRQEILKRKRPILIEPVFGSSSGLARQIALGAPVDIFISADAEILDDLIRHRHLMLDSRIEFAQGRLALVANPNSIVANTSGIEALRMGRFQRIAIPSAAVPLGRYARAWLSTHHLLESIENKIVVTEHARATLSTIDAGLVDLAIVYQSDLPLAKNAQRLALIDPSEHPPIRYVLARTATASSCPAVREMLTIWTTPSTRERLRLAGFTPFEIASDTP